MTARENLYARRCPAVPAPLISGPPDGPAVESHGMCRDALERIRQEAEQEATT